MSQSRYPTTPEPWFTSCYHLLPAVDEHELKNQRSGTSDSGEQQPRGYAHSVSGQNSQHAQWDKDDETLLELAADYCGLFLVGTKHSFTLCWPVFSGEMNLCYLVSNIQRWVNFTPEQTASAESFPEPPTIWP